MHLRSRLPATLFSLALLGAFFVATHLTARDASAQTSARVSAPAPAQNKAPQNSGFDECVETFKKANERMKPPLKYKTIERMCRDPQSKALSNAALGLSTDPQ